MSPGGRPKKSKDIECTCRECGKTYTVPEWMKSNRQFCSRACYAASKAGVVPFQKTTPDEKVCPQCEIPFLVGGQGRPPRNQKHCSMECAGKALGYQSAPRWMSDGEKAWLAAMVDGEGSIVFAKNRPGKNIRLVVFNTDKRLVQRCFEITQTGRVFSRHRGNPKHSEAHHWQCYGFNARVLIRQMLPWLISKRDKALVALGEEPDA